MTIYHVSHLAMGGELSTDYNERSKVMSYNNFFGWSYRTRDDCQRSYESGLIGGSRHGQYPNENPVKSLWTS